MQLIIVILFMVLLYGFIVTLNKDRFAGKPYAPWLIFVIHFLLTLGYMVYTANSPSDSYKYYADSSRATDWLSLYETGTGFVNFIAWPFTHLIGLDYYPTMLVFSFFGLMGIYLAYLAAKEQIREQAAVFLGLGWLELVFLLPNNHFWTSSLGKGSLMIFGLGLSFWGLSRINRRVVPFLLGLMLVYFIRPHIFLAMILAILIGLVFSTSGIKGFLKWPLIILALLTFYFTSDTVLEFTNMDSINILEDTNTSGLKNRANELGKATSGVNINSYSLPMKLFTFLFRPSLFDINGVVALISALENILLMIIAFQILRAGFLGWKHWNGWFKICFFFFLLSSLALAQVTGNLGIAMRQKAQVMPFFLIVYCNAISLLAVARSPVARMPQLAKT